MNLIGATGGRERDGKEGGEGNNYDDDDGGDGEDGEVQDRWGEERSSDCSSGDNDDESGSQQSETHDPAASKRWAGIKKGVRRVATAKSVGRAVLQSSGGRAESGGGSGSGGEGGVKDEEEGTHNPAASKRWAGIKKGVRRVAVAKSVGRAVLRRDGSGGGGSAGDGSDCSDCSDVSEYGDGSLMTGSDIDSDVGSDAHAWSEREEERVLSRVASHRRMSAEHGEELGTLRESYDMMAEELTALEGEHEEMEGRLAAVTQDKMNVRSEPEREKGRQRWERRERWEGR